MKEVPIDYAALQEELENCVTDWLAENKKDSLEQKIIDKVYGLIGDITGDSSSLALLDKIITNADLAEFLSQYIDIGVSHYVDIKGWATTIRETASTIENAAYQWENHAATWEDGTNLFGAILDVAGNIASIAVPVLGDFIAFELNLAKKVMVYGRFIIGEHYRNMYDQLIEMKIETISETHLGETIGMFAESYGFDPKKITSSTASENKSYLQKQSSFIEANAHELGLEDGGATLLRLIEKHIEFYDIILLSHSPNSQEPDKTTTTDTFLEWLKDNIEKFKVGYPSSFSGDPVAKPVKKYTLDMRGRVIDTGENARDLNQQRLMAKAFQWIRGDLMTFVAGLPISHADLISEENDFMIADQLWDGKEIKGAHIAMRLWNAQLYWHFTLICHAFGEFRLYIGFSEDETGDWHANPACFCHNQSEQFMKIYYSEDKLFGLDPKKYKDMDADILATMYTGSVKISTSFALECFTSSEIVYWRGYGRNAGSTHYFSDIGVKPIRLCTNAMFVDPQDWICLSAKDKAFNNAEEQFRKTNQETGSKNPPKATQYIVVSKEVEEDGETVTKEGHIAIAAAFLHNVFKLFGLGWTDQSKTGYTAQARAGSGNVWLVPAA